MPQISEELHNAEGLGNNLQEKLKIESPVAVKYVINTDRNRNNGQDKLSLTICVARPSAPFPDWTPDENHGEDPLQANARKHSGTEQTMGHWSVELTHRSINIFIFTVTVMSFVQTAVFAEC
jgi:hypothetical protein